MNEFLKKIVAALGIAEELAIAELRELAVKYPDQAERAGEIEVWLRAHADPALDPVALAETLAGIGRDIASGQTGIDPDAWAGSV